MNNPFTKFTGGGGGGGWGVLGKNLPVLWRRNGFSFMAEYDCVADNY